MLRLVSVLAIHRLASEAADPQNDMGMRVATSEGVLGGLPGRRRPIFAAARWVLGVSNSNTAPLKRHCAVTSVSWTLPVIYR